MFQHQDSALDHKCVKEEIQCLETSSTYKNQVKGGVCHTDKRYNFFYLTSLTLLRILLVKSKHMETMFI